MLRRFFWLPGAMKWQQRQNTMISKGIMPRKLKTQNGKFRVRVRLAIIGLCLHTFGHNMLLISADVTQGIESRPLMIYGKSSDIFLLSEVCNPILAADSLCGFSQYVYEVCVWMCQFRGALNCSIWIGVFTCNESKCWKLAIESQEISVKFY